MALCILDWETYHLPSEQAVLENAGGLPVVASLEEKALVHVESESECAIAEFLKETGPSFRGGLCRREDCMRATHFRAGLPWLDIVFGKRE